MFVAVVLVVADGVGGASEEAIEGWVPVGGLLRWGGAYPLARSTDGRMCQGMGETYTGPGSSL